MVENTPSWLSTIDGLGLTVPVALTVATPAGAVEIVKTYADCSVTAVFFRSPSGSRVWPHIVEPIEISGGGGRMIGDLSFTDHGPIEPGRKEIVISFDRSAPWEDRAGVVVPVDRARTARFDRYLTGGPHQDTREGVRASVVAVRAGLMRAAADLSIEALDPSILALLVDRHGPPRILRGPNAGELWNEWLPPPMNPQHVERRERDGRITVSLRSGFTVSARRLSPEEIKALPPRKERPEPWTAESLPGGERLSMQGMSESGSGRSERVGRKPTIYFDAPAPAAAAIRVSLDQLWAFRPDHARAVLPPPQPDEAVDLGGAVLEGTACRIRLQQWDPSSEGFRLRGQVDPPGVWPDLRVLAGDSSTSLWTQPADEGVFSGALPLSYAALLDRPAVEIALRTMAHVVTPMAFVLPLSAADDRMRK